MHRIATVLLILACAAIGLWFFLRPTPPTQAAPAAHATVASARAPVQRLAAMAADNAATRTLTVDEKQLADYLCAAEDRACAQARNTAKSQAEAAWLLQAGFASPRRQAELDAMSVDQLRDKADAGDLAARVRLGQRLIEQGDKRAGHLQLVDAQLAGSVEAAYAHAAVYAPDGPTPNLIDNAAYYRLAYLQGDWKAATPLAIAEEKMNPMERVMVDHRAMNLYQNHLEELAHERRSFKVWTRPM